MSDLANDFGFPEQGDTEDQQRGPLPGTNMHPALQRFMEAFTEPQAQDWAREVAIRSDDYLQQRQLNTNAEAAGNQFVQQLSRFKNGLASWVQNDPGAVHTAMSLVSPTLATIIGESAVHPTDQLQDAHDQLANHMRQEIARSAVTSMAEQHGAAATALLNHPDIYTTMSAEDRQSLQNYIQSQHNARVTDGNVRLEGAARQGQQQDAQTAVARLSDMWNPDQQKFDPPQNFAQRVMGDASVSASAKQRLLQIYTTIAQDTALRDSEPGVYMSLLRSLVSSAVRMDVAPLLDAVQGKHINLPDAIHLGRAFSGNPQDREHLMQLYQTAQYARSRIVGRDGENGVAGNTAFTRFLSSLAASARSDNGMPSGNDLEQAIAKGMPNGDDLYKGYTAFNEHARMLKDIFGATPAEQAGSLTFAERYNNFERRRETLRNLSQGQSQ